MSNYPPGVTGNEYPIAGGQVHNESVTCTADTEYIPAHLVKQAIEDCSPARLQAVIDEIDGIEAECNFEGEVEVDWYQGVGTWTCPRCGNENTIEDDGTDPDYQRDLRREGF